VSCPQVPVMMLTQKSNKKKEVWKSVGVLFPSTVWWESYHENGKRILVKVDKKNVDVCVTHELGRILIT
jgi:hypothetical protein